VRRELNSLGWDAFLEPPGAPGLASADGSSGSGFLAGFKQVRGVVGVVVSGWVGRWVGG